MKHYDASEVIINGENYKPFDWYKVESAEPTELDKENRKVNFSVTLTLTPEGKAEMERFRKDLTERLIRWRRLQEDWVDSAIQAYWLAGIPVAMNYVHDMPDGSIERGLLGPGGYLLTSRVFRIVGLPK